MFLVVGRGQFDPLLRWPFTQRVTLTLLDQVGLRLYVYYAARPRGSWRWWRGTVVERRSLAGELSLSCARPAADG